MRAVERVEIEAGQGILGDRYHGSKHRHVTVQSLDDLREAARIHARPVPAGLTRRNLTLDTGPVPTGQGEQLRVGDVLLEVFRVAAPCKLLDDHLGPGAVHALRDRAGSVFRVLEGGILRVGDAAVTT